MELDAGALALKGCTVQEEDKNALMQVLKKYEKEIERKKYIMWSQNDMTVTLEKGIVKVEGTGGLDFPFFNMYEGNVNGFWSTSTGYENHRIDPVSFIRTYRKITGGE